MEMHKVALGVTGFWAWWGVLITVASKVVI